MHFYIDFDVDVDSFGAAVNIDYIDSDSLCRMDLNADFIFNLLACLMLSAYSNYGAQVILSVLRRGIDFCVLRMYFVFCFFHPFPFILASFDRILFVYNVINSIVYNYFFRSCSTLSLHQVCIWCSVQCALHRPIWMHTNHREEERKNCF